MSPSSRAVTSDPKASEFDRHGCKQLFWARYVGCKPANEVGVVGPQRFASRTCGLEARSDRSQAVRSSLNGPHSIGDLRHLRPIARQRELGITSPNVTNM